MSRPYISTRSWDITVIHSLRTATAGGFTARHITPAMTRGSTPEGITIRGSTEDTMTPGFMREDIMTRGTGILLGTEDTAGRDGTTRGTARGETRGAMTSIGITTVTGIIRTAALSLRDITTRSSAARHTDTEDMSMSVQEAQAAG